MDIILRITRLLTRVQMPIRDGLSTTHALRTEAPFKDMADVRNVPIVAMTASAIQGDKEKCQQAGMDVGKLPPAQRFGDAEVRRTT